MTDAIPDPLATAQGWLDAGHGVTLATVLSTWGSAPRQAGAQLAIRDDELFEGSVSGGCIEGEVIAEAQRVIAAGQPKILDYGVSDARAWEAGLACGGRISIYLEPVES